MSALMDVENSLQPAKREWVNEVAGLLAAQQGYDFDKVSYAKRQDFQDQANEIVEVLSSKMYLDIQGLLLDRDKYIDLLLEERDFLLERSNWWKETSMPTFSDVLLVVFGVPEAD